MREESYAVMNIFENGARTIHDLDAVSAYGTDQSIEPDERIMTLSLGVHELTARVLEAMESTICDERVSDDEADAFYQYAERIASRER